MKTEDKFPGIWACACGWKMWPSIGKGNGGAEQEFIWMYVLIGYSEEDQGRQLGRKSEV